MARLTFVLLFLCVVSVTPTLHKLKALKEKLLFGGGRGCSTCGMMHSSNGGGGGYGGGSGGGFGFGYGGGGGFGGGGGGGGEQYGGNRGHGQMYDYGANKGHGQMYDQGQYMGHGGHDGYAGQTNTVVVVKEVPNVQTYGGNQGGDYGSHAGYGGNKGFHMTGGDSPIAHGRPGGYSGGNAGSYASSSASSFSSAGSSGWNQGGGQPNVGHGSCSTCGGSGGDHMPTGFVAPGTYANSQSSSSANAGSYGK